MKGKRRKGVQNNDLNLLYVSNVQLITCFVSSKMRKVREHGKKHFMEACVMKGIRN